MSDLQYPIGKWTRTMTLDANERVAAIEALAIAPGSLRAAVAGLSDAQLETPYRDGGWNVRQVAHHLPDSHLNGYVRSKLALTEENPTIKPYDEAAWAELADSVTTPVDVSLALLDALHVRWIALLRSMPPEAFARTVTHPDNGSMTIDSILSLYAWHGAHHVAQITGLRNRMGW